MRRKNSALGTSLSIVKWTVFFGGLGGTAYGVYYAYNEFRKMFETGKNVPGEKPPPGYPTWDGKRKAEYWAGRWWNGVKNIYGAAVPGGSSAIKILDSITHPKPKLAQASPEEVQDTKTEIANLNASANTRQWTADERSMADWFCYSRNWTVLVDNYPGLIFSDNAQLHASRVTQLIKYGDWWNASEGRMNLKYGEE